MPRKSANAGWPRIAGWRRRRPWSIRALLCSTGNRFDPDAAIPWVEGSICCGTKLLAAGGDRAYRLHAAARRLFSRRARTVSPPATIRSRRWALRSASWSSAMRWRCGTPATSEARRARARHRLDRRCRLPGPLGQIRGGRHRRAGVGRDERHRHRRLSLRHPRSVGRRPAPAAPPMAPAATPTAALPSPAH